MSSIVSIVFFPVGLVALLFSYLSNDRFEGGDYHEARRYSRYARNWSIGLIAIEAVLLAVFLAWFVFIAVNINHAASEINTSNTAGGALVTVPNLAGQDNVSAFQTLSNVGLQEREADHASSTVAFGNVIAWSPAAGTRVHQGATVTVAISCGSYVAGICQ